MELALAHTVGSAVEQAYRRSDLLEQRRTLMHEWALFGNRQKLGRSRPYCRARTFAGVVPSWFIPFRDSGGYQKPPMCRMRTYAAN